MRVSVAALSAGLAALLVVSGFAQGKRAVDAGFSDAKLTAPAAANWPPMAEICSTSATRN
jgi:hypothetical protein